LTLFAFVLVVGLVQLAVAPGEPAMGILTNAGVSPMSRFIPLPTPPGLDGEEAIQAYHYWTFFWAFPYAKLFWTVVVLAAFVSLFLHLARARLIWRS
jgi:hypothetical protein